MLSINPPYQDYKMAITLKTRKAIFLSMLCIGVSCSAFSIQAKLAKPNYEMPDDLSTSEQYKHIKRNCAFSNTSESKLLDTDLVIITERYSCDDNHSFSFSFFKD